MVQVEEEAEDPDPATGSASQEHLGEKLQASCGSRIGPCNVFEAFRT
jgi:hypothetical protein